ncbi:MAG: SGNH/GDSL hydrolase family protein [Lentisphaeria bacterium]|jgi:acyl-CoA thioesterase-1|nr:SGNH/GDSL hydrolase family protein [Lentisphaeria bacterium]
MAEYSTTVREDIEWLGIRWHDEASSAGLPRVLLIGDSIVVGHGTMLRDRLRGRWGVDYFATSKVVSDHEYMPDLEFMMARHDYQAIIFNNGLHGSQVADTTYAAALAAVVAVLKARTAHLVWRNSTPCYVLPGREDKGWTERVQVRNRLAAAVMAAAGVPILDAYALLAGQPELSSDGVHFTAAGYAKLVAAEADDLEGLRVR